MAKNLMPDVLKLLGVEYDERFKLTNTDGVITENDVFCFFEHGLSHALQDGEYEDASDILYDILAGNYEIVKLPWEPKYKERYYRPNIMCKEVSNELWSECTLNYALKALGMIYRTKEEAIEHFAEDYERLTGKPLSRGDSMDDNGREKNTYDVDVVVTITLQAENQNDACSKAQKLVDECLDGQTNNNFYPDWIGIRKCKYSC